MLFCLKDVDVYVSRELYESACVAKKWSIVRPTHGLLGKKMHNLALSLTDLLVRQKQVTVGLPPHQEIIISQPIGSWLNISVLVFDLNLWECGKWAPCDYLEIRDGESNMSSLVGKFSRKRIPSFIQLSHNKVWMR